MSNIIDERNSKAAGALGSAATYTGGWRDVSEHASFSILINGDAGEDVTLYIDYSIDGATAARTETIPIADVSIAPLIVRSVISQFFRVRVVNGVTALTTFALQTILHKEGGVINSPLVQGSQPYKGIDVDETEEAIKASPGKLDWLHVMNMSASVLYLKLYDDTTTNVVVGTTVPTFTFPIPTLATTNGAGFVIALPQGIDFKKAITVAATTGIADNDSGAPGANEVVVNAGYR